MTSLKIHISSSGLERIEIRVTDLISNIVLVQDISTLLQEYTFDFAQYLEVKEVWLGFLIALSIVAAIYVLLLIFFIKRIRIATRLLAEASKVSTFLKMGSELLRNSGYNFSIELCSIAIFTLNQLPYQKVL